MGAIYLAQDNEKEIHIKLVVENTSRYILYKN